MRMFRAVALALGASVVFAACAPAQNAEFTETLKKNRGAIGVQDGKLAGPTAEVLRTALEEAHFVALGEDHGIRQIPEFSAALCAELAPHGFHHMALEIGPEVAPDLERFARAVDGVKQLTEFLKKYPETVAFYDWQEEFAMLQQCQKATAPGHMTIWGLDQEFMGAGGFLLDKIQATNLGPEAKAAIETLVKENNDAHAAAAKSGNPGDLLMMAAKQEELDRVRDLLKNQAKPEAQKLFEDLLVSREIYKKNMTGDYYSSNRQRALLMKKNFSEPFAASPRNDGVLPKVFFKFGAYHMFRGINPLHSSEIGNLIGEAAEANQFKSVHILIVGVKGEQLHFAGIGRPPEAAPLDLAGDKDSDFLFFKPLFDVQVENSWTLYDLRALRDHFSKYGKIDPELERVIFGYDFVVFIPDPKASHTIQ
ncbi:MAG TPA: hypothetical protein VKH15_10820 [Candidatus Acidoferrum sp.]|nr:hypothetical protein [Candidatus Acidoferrum sp.]